MRVYLASSFAACTALFSLACGDDSTSGGGSGGGGSSGSSTASSATNGPSTGNGSTSSSPSSSNGSSGGGGDSTSSVSTGSGGATGSTSTGSNPVGSAGCGIAPTEATGEWLAKTTDVGGVVREWFVYLPAGYDAERAYPVVYQFHGCSGSPTREDNNVPIQNESGADAIVVRGRAVGDCWESGGGSPDIAFFDAMVGAVEGAYCADPERRMAVGYSSGAFMTHQLACSRGAELRGVATIAGGQTGSGCTGQVAALLIHDTGDGTVGIGASEGARDQNLEANGCGQETAPFDPAPCVAYQGCQEGSPVVWCQTSGSGHDRQDGLAAPAFWSFLSAL
jgi:polyhydroxybutyrate depolymerase